jgi:hypothetical protein
MDIYNRKSNLADCHTLFIVLNNGSTKYNVHVDRIKINRIILLLIVTYSRRDVR